MAFIFPEGTITLNDEQSRIVRQPPNQPLRILASAGSGKTTTLTARIAYLLTHVGAKPSEIILLTFTHNSAAVMRSRLESLVGPQQILCGTFHSISQQILRNQNPASLNDIYHVDELPLKALDFLATAAGKRWASTLKWIFIDEFQDINDTQYNFIRALHHPSATVTIVGDDAQNIYTWRGSCVDYILNFHKRFDDVADFQLTTNYRSTGAIVAVANSIMRNIPTLPHKELMTAAPAASAGERPEIYYFSKSAEERDWVAEAAANATGSTVILSKFNSVLYGYEAALLNLGVRCRFVEGDAILSDTSIGPRTVYLSTFHGSKGLEWDNVFIVRMNDDVFPQQKDEDSVLQERRLFYVAVTRARRVLTFTYSRHERSLTRFIREIHKPLLVWRNLPRYELSTLSAVMTPTNARDWINYLTGEDFRTIKQLGFLPPSLRDPELYTPIQEFRTTWCIPVWWVEQGMSTEFYDFLRAFWFRAIAQKRSDSAGQWDRDAQRVIWTIKIAADDAVLFELHRPLFEELANHFFGATPRGTAPPQIYYTEVLAAIRAAAPGTHFDQETQIRIIQIIHKMRTMLYNLRFANIALSELTFSPIRHSPPQESRCGLIEAWRLYTNGTHSLTPTTEEIAAIYQIGLCRALGEGRSGVLTSLPGLREWSRCRPFLTEFQARASALVETHKSDRILCRIQVPLVDGVVADIDMLVGQTAWFFIGGDSTSELQRLDRMVAILLAVHAARIAGYPIQKVAMFQMLTGAILEWPCNDWSTSTAELMTAFIQARVSHASS